MKKVVTMIDILLKQKALIIMVSDFIGMESGWERYIKMMAEKYDLIGIMLRDPRDRVLPDGNGQYLLEDPSSKERVYIDVNDYRKIYAAAVQEDEQYVRNVFSTAKAGFVTVSTDGDLILPVLDYFKRRSKIIKS